MAYTNRDQIYEWLSGLLLLEFHIPELREGLRGPKDEDLLLQATLYISLECTWIPPCPGLALGRGILKVPFSPAPDSALHTEIVPDCLVDDSR